MKLASKSTRNLLVRLFTNENQIENELFPPPVVDSRVFQTSRLFQLVGARFCTQIESPSANL